MRRFACSHGLFVALLLLFGTLSCGETGTTTLPDGDDDSPSDGDITPGDCLLDEDCPESLLCFEGRCITEGDSPCAREGFCNRDTDCGEARYCNDLCTCQNIAGGDADSDETPSDGDTPSDCAAGPKLTVPPNLDFGNVPYDTDASRTLNLYNECPEHPLVITSMDFVEATNEFRLLDVPTLPVTLSGQSDSLTITVVYHPKDVGMDENTILISSNDPAGATRVQVISRYKGTNAIEADPNPVDFQQVVVGEAAAVRTLILRNKQTDDAGNAVLRVNAVRLETGTGGIFSLQTPATPFYIGQGQERELTLRCHPPTPGDFTDRLIVESNDPDDPSLAVDLFCTGVLPVMAVETLEAGNLLDFGVQRVGRPADVVLQVSNAGGGELRVQLPVFTSGTSAAFTMDLAAFGPNWTEIVLTAGQSARLPVRYHATQIGQDSGGIRLTSNGYGSETLTVALAGRAVAGSLGIDPTTLSFGDVRVGATQRLDLTYTNEGELPILLETIAFVGLAEGMAFGQDSVVENVTLEPGESHPVAVLFTPPRRGVFNTRVQVSTDDAVEAERDTVVNARGVAPVMEILTSSGAALPPPQNPNHAGRLDFGNVSINRDLTRQIRVRNAGDYPLALSAFALTANTPSDEFSFTDPGVVNVPAGNFTTLSLSYAPVGLPGSDAGLFAITGNDDEAGQQIVELTGVATNQRLGFSYSPPLNFGALYFGASREMTLVLTNAGLLGTLLVEYVEIVSGSNAFSLDLSGVNWPVSLGPDGNGEFQIPLIFQPPAGDAASVSVPYTGTLRIHSNSYLAIQYDYALQGSGEPCPPGCWDLDSNPHDCEYCGCYVSNNGVEICDNQDNDCNGHIDDGPGVTGNCTPPSNATAVCASGGTCDFSCNPSFHRCGSTCVYDWHPNHCGDRCTSCPDVPANATATCVERDGQPTCEWDCNSGYTWHHNACRLVGGTECCGPHCLDCGPNPSNGSWSCQNDACTLFCVSDYHPCGSLCYWNFSTATCGTRCTACTTPPSNGQATCDGLTCGISCQPGFYPSGTSCLVCDTPQYCGASCAPCPVPPANGQATCDGTFCGILCNPGHYRDGTECKTCNTATHCGSSCLSCGALANGSYSCADGNCTPTCNSGYVLNNGQCVSGNTADCCGPSCQQCPGGQNSFGICAQVSPDNWQCRSQCNDNYWDLDNDGTNCEYYCVREGDNDDPDDDFTDSNCDGIDGTVSKSIFVATPADGGNDSNAGTKTSPLATIQAAVVAATGSSTKKTVLVSRGEYIGPVYLSSGVRLHGGYSKSNGWARGVGYVATIRTNTADTGTRLVGVYANDLTTLAILDRFTIVTANNPNVGGSNYGVYVKNSNLLQLRGLSIVMGRGGNGQSGGNGSTPGITGQIGGTGQEGCDDGHTWACDFGGYTCSRPNPGTGGNQTSCPYGTAPGRGGAGGASGKDNEGSGRNGSPGEDAPSGGAGGAGGTCCSPPGEHGSSGLPGSPGSQGSDGSGGLSFGNIASGYYLPSNGAAGTDGSGGRGGGGGGGGGGGVSTALDCESYGGAGGGGGSGGCAGSAGSNGTGGGGVFGVWFVNSQPTLVNLVISAARGGNGGSGGTAGNGTNGGSGGGGGPGEPSSVNDPSGNGGSGGAGGAGGRGGHGGGGGGGPSYCFYNASGTPPQTGTFTCNGYEGGQGGSSNGNSGQTGSNGQRNW